MLPYPHRFVPAPRRLSEGRLRRPPHDVRPARSLGVGDVQHVGPGPDQRRGDRHEPPVTHLLPNHAHERVFRRAR